MRTNPYASNAAASFTAHAVGAGIKLSSLVEDGGLKDEIQRLWLAWTDEADADGLTDYPVGERFFQEFTLRQVLLNAAKNACGLSAGGTSSRAEGPNTAEPAATMAYPAREASPEPTGSSALTASTA